MNKYLITITAFLLLNGCHAVEQRNAINQSEVLSQDSSTWTKQLGAITLGSSSSGYDLCRAVSTDSSGNVYCAGRTNGNLGETNGGGKDAFIVKLDNSGSVRWITQLGADTIGDGSSGDDYCYAVTVDTSGNIYCAGRTGGSLGESFGGGSSDAFIVKMDPSGALIWVTQLGAETIGDDSFRADSCNGVAVDSSDNVYCAGSTFGNLGESNGGGKDGFVVKLDRSGKLIWTTQLGKTTMGTGSSDDDTCSGVSVDKNGSVYCAGSTSGSLIEKNGGTGKSTDAFIVKLNSSGNVQWSKQFGAVSNPGRAGGADYCNGVSVDFSDNVYCAGSTSGSLGEKNGGGFYDAFIVKLNSAGNVQWLTQLGAETKPGASSGTDACYGISTDFSGNVYCAGYTSEALGETSGGSDDAFAMKLNSKGKVQWVAQLGAKTNAAGSSSHDSCSGVSVDRAGSVYCAGSTKGSLGESKGGGGSDAFIMKVNAHGYFAN